MATINFLASSIIINFINSYKQYKDLKHKIKLRVKIKDKSKIETFTCSINRFLRLASVKM